MFTPRNLESDIKAGLTKLHYTAGQMELYRTVPEWIDIYNAETAAQHALANSKLISKLIGDRVALEFTNGGDLPELTGKPVTAAIGNEPSKDLAMPTTDKPRDFIRPPLAWDRNWTWDT